MCERPVGAEAAEQDGKEDVQDERWRERIGRAIIVIWAMESSYGG